jgi:hypothetical protein
MPVQDAKAGKGTAAKPTATAPETQQQSDNDVSQAIKDAEPKGLAEVPKAPIEPHGATRGGYATDLGTGFEDFTQDDVAVPFVSILQKGSPQVEDENPKQVKGAKAGMLYNNVTGELYDGKAGIHVVPVHRVRNFIEWIPKDDGGGLVNVFDPSAPEVAEALKKAGKKFGKIKIGDNNDLVETVSVFCLIAKPDNSTQRVIISFASSQLAGFKKWMTTAQSIQIPAADGSDRMVVPPMFSHLYKLTTFFFQKKENTWYKWLASFALGEPSPNAEASRLAEGTPLYEAAREFRAMVVSGRAQADFQTAQQEPEAAEAEYDM